MAVAVYFRLLLSGHAEKNRSFTSAVDSLMQAHETSSNLARVAESPESLIKMILTGRIDYTIEYPIVASYNQEKLNAAGELVSIPIAKMDTYSYVYMTCTKNEWGKTVIERWNEELQTLKPTDRYRKITEIGHTDENELAQIRTYYDAFIEADK